MRDEIYQRELGWMELVARAFFEFFQNIKGILFVMVVVFLPVVLLDGVILTRLNAISSFLSAVQAAGTVLENREGIMQAMNQTIIGSVMNMAIELFLVPVGTIAIAKIVKQRIDGEEPDVKTALKETLALGPTIILSGLIYGVLVTLGMIVLIPGIWYSVFAGLYVYCVGLGGRKGWDSLEHSGELVRGRWWRTAGFIIALNCIGALWNMLFQVILVFGGSSFAATVIYGFFTYFSAIFADIGLVLLFINRESQYLGWQTFGEKKKEELDFTE